MLTVEIVNDGTGTNAVGNYDYRVLVNGRVIAEGRVEGHGRAERWPRLLLEVSKDGERRGWVRFAADLDAFIRREEEEGDGRRA